MQLIPRHATVFRHLQCLSCHPLCFIVPSCAGSASCLAHSIPPAQQNPLRTLIFTYSSPICHRHNKDSRATLLPAMLSFMLEKATYSSLTLCFRSARKPGPQVPTNGSVGLLAIVLISLANHLLSRSARKSIDGRRSSYLYLLACWECALVKSSSKMKAVFDDVLRPLINAL